MRLRAFCILASYNDPREIPPLRPEMPSRADELVANILRLQTQRENFVYCHWDHDDHDRDHERDHDRAHAHHHGDHDDD